MNDDLDFYNEEFYDDGGDDGFWFIDDEPDDFEYLDYWDGELVGSYAVFDAYEGVAFRIVRDNNEDTVVAIMVGDDREFYMNRIDVITVDRESFCGECGQVGCYHDSLDREMSFA